MGLDSFATDHINETELSTKDLLPQRMEQVYHHGLNAVPFNFVLSVFCIITFTILKVSFTQLLYWGLVMLVILVLRMVYIRRIIKLNDWSHTPRYREIIFAVGALATGLLWGGLYFLVIPYLSGFEHSVIAIVLAGVCAGSLVSMAGSRISYYCYMLPALLAIFVKQVSVFQTANIALAITTIIYIIFLFVVHKINFDSLLDNMRLVIKKEQLNKIIFQVNSQLEKTNKKIRKISLTDELTQIANRHHFKKQLLTDWIHAKRTSTPISLIIIDIDFFKQYNDNYGHLHGDECVKKVAQLIVSSLTRNTDLAARYGGDELAVILFDTDKDGAYKVAKRIKANIDNAKIPHGHSKVSDQVTVSMGTSTMIPERHDHYDKLMVLADQALYAAKDKGRNNIVVSDE